MEYSKITKSTNMRIKEFFIRTSLFLPMAVFGILVFLMLFGIGADLMGAEKLFYCTIYCKICVALLSIGAAAVIYCQARACWKK